MDCLETTTPTKRATTKPLRCWPIRILLGKANAASSDVTTEAVANDSHKACIEFVYADEVKAHLQRLEKAGETKVAKISLSQVYLKAAGAIAKSQANKAGWRVGRDVEEMKFGIK
ncbi:MAG: hypothetical protein ACI87E_004018 [Mariniblastus sp.]|jgi:hypothetical protein